jgi:hypothetical protein
MGPSGVRACAWVAEHQRRHTTSSFTELVGAAAPELDFHEDLVAVTPRHDELLPQALSQAAVGNALLSGVGEKRGIGRGFGRIRREYGLSHSHRCRVLPFFAQGSLALKVGLGHVGSAAWFAQKP